jgi:hypothetical protein
VQSTNNSQKYKIVTLMCDYMYSACYGCYRSVRLCKAINALLYHRPTNHNPSTLPTMTGLLFVTAPEADHKLINRLLLYLRDWEYGAGDTFKLVISRNIEEFTHIPDSGGRQDDLNDTVPPVSLDIANEWAGASVEEVEAWCIELDGAGVSRSLPELNPYHYIIVDAQGVPDKTCIFGSRATQDEPFAFLEWFEKTRLPWDEAYLVWCNLDIANMGFEDFVEDNESEHRDHWWTFRSVNNGPDLSDENRAKRDAEIEILEREGQA